MPAPANKENRRLWDARLVAWMSRPSSTTKDSGQARAVLGVSHVALMSIAALASGVTYWIAVAGISVLLLPTRHVWPLARRARAARRAVGAAPNPFGR